MNGKSSFVEPKSWIRNDRIRDIILFDKEMDQVRYNAVIKACQLEEDLKVLPSYDLTEIGEQGINLSGGQKARVSLARAVYANAEVLLLDDPVSALDVQVRRKIFQQVFKGICKDKTRVLVTHAIDFLHICDKIVIMDEGMINACGTFEELKNNEILSNIMATHDYTKQMTLEQTKVEETTEEKVEKKDEKKEEKKDEKKDEKNDEKKEEKKEVDESKGKLTKDAD